MRFFKVLISYLFLFFLSFVGYAQSPQEVLKQHQKEMKSAKIPEEFLKACQPKAVDLTQKYWLNWGLLKIPKKTINYRDELQKLSLKNMDKLFRKSFSADHFRDFIVLLDLDENVIRTAYARAFVRLKSKMTPQLFISLFNFDRKYMYSDFKKIIKQIGVAYENDFLNLKPSLFELISFNEAFMYEENEFTAFWQRLTHHKTMHFQSSNLLRMMRPYNDILIIREIEKLDSSSLQDLLRYRISQEKSEFCLKLIALEKIKTREVFLELSKQAILLQDENLTENVIRMGFDENWFHSAHEVTDLLKSWGLGNSGTSYISKFKKLYSGQFAKLSPQEEDIFIWTQSDKKTFRTEVIRLDRQQENFVELAIENDKDGVTTFAELQALLKKKPKVVTQQVRSYIEVVIAANLDHLLQTETLSLGKLLMRRKFANENVLFIMKTYLETGMARKIIVLRILHYYFPRTTDIKEFLAVLNHPYFLESGIFNDYGNAMIKHVSHFVSLNPNLKQKEAFFSIFTQAEQRTLAEQEYRDAQTGGKARETQKLSPEDADLPSGVLCTKKERKRMFGIF